MRLAISNIAWDVSHDEDIAKLLERYRVDAIDIAPGKYFPDIKNVSDAQKLGVKNWWADRGISITGMQALLFGTTGLNMFGSPESREAMLAHLGAVCRIGGSLGAKFLVFGSPKNRDLSRLVGEAAMDAAVSFFWRLGNIADSCGVVICLEPNPPRYGANFMTTSLEAAEVVEHVAHPAIKMQLDTGAMTINGEDIESVIKRSAQLIGHVHASEPDLMPLGDGTTDHRKISLALEKYLPQQPLVSVEMLATKCEPHLASVERALKCAIASYCSPGN